MPRRRRFFPFIRLGLTLVVGAALISLVQYYVALGDQAADLKGPDTLPANREEFLHHLVKDVLFAGTRDGIVFWIGVALIFMGIARLLMPGRRQA